MKNKMDDEYTEVSNYRYCMVITHRDNNGRLLFKEQFGAENDPYFYTKF